MVKFAGTRFLEWDEQLEYDGIRPKANTSDLNEELGQVSVGGLTIKTPTLWKP